MMQDGFSAAGIRNDRKKIKRITIDYKFVSAAIPVSASADIAWEYKDRLVIDGEAGTIEDVLRCEGRYDIKRMYHVVDGVTGFLNCLNAERLFTEFCERDDDVLPPCDGTAVYEVKLEFYHQKPRVISGTYDKQGLPLDWPQFIEKLYDFISGYGLGEMFDETLYARARRKKNEYICLSVKFGDYGKRYYYLTDDDTIRVGEQVVVPVGTDGTERIVRVCKKEYFSEDNLPMTLDRVKSIIGRFVPPQENENGERLIYCPMCDKTINTYVCDDILFDLLDGIPHIITRKEIEAKWDICRRCKYHDD